jgi:mRNA interferase HicA
MIGLAHCWFLGGRVGRRATLPSTPPSAGAALERFASTRQQSHPSLANIDIFVYSRDVNSSQFRRYLAKAGCTFEEGKRHTLVRRGGRMAALPRHGGKKQLGTGLMNAIKKELAIE